jgi:hypothetical protein
MPKKPAKRGTLTIDRIVPSVGRIVRASGTKSKVEFNRRNRMISELYERGYLSVLADLRDKRVSVAELYARILQDGYEVFQHGEALRNLCTGFSEWLDARECSDDYRRTLRTTARYIHTHAPTAVVADLPQVVQRLRDVLPPPSFNRTRAHLMAFAARTLGRRHPSTLGLLDVERKTEHVQRVAVRLSPKTMSNLFPAPLTDPVDAVAWSLVTTGMGPKEFWGSWQTSEDRVHVHGTKRKSRNRVIPNLCDPVPPSISLFTFGSQFRRRTTRTMVPYQLRGTYAHWLEEARIQRTRRMMYMGHSAGDTTERYERHEVDAFLRADQEALRQYVQSQLDAETPDQVRQLLRL